MEMCIKLVNPTERELQLINELSQIEIEKGMEERRYMEDYLLTKLPDTYRDLMKKEQGLLSFIVYQGCVEYRYFVFKRSILGYPIIVMIKETVFNCSPWYIPVVQ